MDDASLRFSVSVISTHLSGPSRSRHGLIEQPRGSPLVSRLRHSYISRSMETGLVRKQEGGQPVKAALMALIESRGGLDHLWEMFEDGKTMGEVAATLVLTYPNGEQRAISRSFLSGLLNKDESTRARLKEARRIGAMPLVEDAMQIADDVPADRDEVAKARLRVDTRFRLAGALDKETFGPKGIDVKVQANFGDVYLNALRAAPRQAPPASDALPVKDAEIIEEKTT